MRGAPLPLHLANPMPPVCNCVSSLCFGQFTGYLTTFICSRKAVDVAGNRHWQCAPGRGQVMNSKGNRIRTGLRNAASDPKGTPGVRIGGLFCVCCCSWHPAAVLLPQPSPQVGETRATAFGTSSPIHGPLFCTARRCSHSCLQQFQVVRSLAQLHRVACLALQGPCYCLLQLALLSISINHG